MLRRGAALLVLLTVLGQGCAGAPSAPEVSGFQLTSGAYRLSFVGTDCFVGTFGQPSTPHSSVVELHVVLAASEGGFALTSPGHPISGQLEASSSTLTGTMAGSALVGALRFRTGASEEDPIVLGGVARDGDRFEGQLTAGRPQFSISDAGGSSTAFCMGATFMLRRV